MINILLKLAPFVTSFFSKSKEAAAQKKPRLIYIKRVLFSVFFVLAVWGFFWPLSLSMRLQHASELLPDWFVQALVILFTAAWV